MRKVIVIILISGLALASMIGAGGCAGNANTGGVNAVESGLSEQQGGGMSGEYDQLIADLSSADGDVRREAVLKLGEGELAESNVTVKFLATMAETDQEAQVRAVALEVISRLDQGEEMPAVFLRAAQDESVLVRMVCAEGLRGRGDEVSMGLLLTMLSYDPEGSIRVAAAAGLGNFQTKAVVRELIRALAEDVEFGVWYRAKESLKKLTGKDFGYDHQAWRRWFESVEDPFVDKKLEVRS